MMVDDVTPVVALLVEVGDLGAAMGGGGGGRGSSNGADVDVNHMISLHLRLTSLLPPHVLVARLVASVLDKRPQWRIEFIMQMLLLTLENPNKVESFSFLQFSYFDGSGRVERAVANIISKSWATMRSGFVFDFQKCGDSVTPATFKCIWDAVLQSSRHVVCKVPAPIYNALILDHRIDCVDDSRLISERIVCQRAAPPTPSSSTAILSSSSSSGNKPQQSQNAFNSIGRPKILLKRPPSSIIMSSKTMMTVTMNPPPVETAAADGMSPSSVLQPQQSTAVSSSSPSSTAEASPHNHPPQRLMMRNGDNALTALYSQNVAAAKSLFEEHDIPIEDLFHNSKRHVIFKFIDQLILDPKTKALGHDIESASKLLRRDSSIEAAVKSGRSTTAGKRRPREEVDEGVDGVPHSNHGGCKGGEKNGESSSIGFGNGSDGSCGDQVKHHHPHQPSSASQSVGALVGVADDVRSEEAMFQWAAGMWSGYVLEEMSLWRDGDLLVETSIRHGEGTTNQQAMLCAAKYLLHTSSATPTSASSSGVAEEEEGGSGRGTSVASAVDASLLEEVRRFMNL